jgi:inositol oxygenase
MNAAMLPLTTPCHVHRFGAVPNWSVNSETYPVGCAYSEFISGSTFVTGCPDRRCAKYSTPNGIYTAGCGLDSVHFTWTATEYLTMVVLLNKTLLPFEAIFLLRFQNFFSAIRYGAYDMLYDARDIAALPLLRRFHAVLDKVRMGEAPRGLRLSRSALLCQCQAAIQRYFPSSELCW